jgi:molybdate transport system regulatory protein
VGTYIFLQLSLSNGTGFGPHRCAILEAIDRYGSITAAARAVGRTYPWVYRVVQSMNEMYGGLVIIQNGGPNSGASLTERGRELSRLFRRMEGKVYASLEAEIRKFEKLGDEPPGSPAVIPRHLQVVPPIDRKGAAKKKKRS